MSDYNDTGWVAVYEPGGFNTSEDVHSWDSEGNAMIVDRESGGLVPAASQEGFKCLEETNRIVAAIPAAKGWNLKVWEKETPDASIFVAPIAAWLVTAAGQLVPVADGSDDYLEPVICQRTQIYPPGEPTS